MHFLRHYPAYICCISEKDMPPFFIVEPQTTTIILFIRRQVMVDTLATGNNWESMIKLFLSRLDIPSKEDINLLHGRLDTLEQLLGQGKLSAALQGTDSTGRRKSASSIVLDVIANHPEGTNFKTIKAATGFNDKKLRNIIFRLDKIEKIARVKRGIYKKI